MIEINLLAQELRPRPKKPGIDFESKETLYFIPLIFGAILIVHIYLAGALLFKNFQAAALNAKWQKLQAQRNALELFRADELELSEDARALQQINSQAIKWAAKLNKLSLDLPTGVWFKDITATPKNLSLRGAVISLNKTEMQLVNKFMDNLKADRDLFGDFTKLELDSVERKAIGGYEVVDFNLSAALKGQ
jgi:Tfp pilus assembly protein PilN